MTANFHVPFPSRFPLNAAEFESRAASLDAGITALASPGSTWVSTLDGQANSGQKVVPVAATGSDLVGKSVILIAPDGTWEIGQVASVSDGVSVTLAANLAHTFPVASLISAQAAVVASVIARDSWRFNVRSYGAAGDGTTDDTTAIQAAITAAAAAGGGTVFLPTGTYRTTSALTVPSNVTIEGMGSSSLIKVDHTGWGISTYGTATTRTAIAADALHGVTQVNVGAGQVANYDAGKLLWLQCDVVATNVAGQYRGELHEIDSVSSPNVLLRGATFEDNKVADTAKACAVTPVRNVRIRNLAMTHTYWTDQPTVAVSALVAITLSANCSVSGCHFYQSNGAAVQIDSSLTCGVVDCTMEDLRDDPVNTILGYGVTVGHASRNIAITGCRMGRCRHAVTGGSSASGPMGAYGVARGVAVTGCVASACTAAGFDTHEDMIGVAYTGCWANACQGAGFYMRGRDITITGGGAESCKGIGIYLGSASQHVTLSGVIVRGTSLSTALDNGYGVWINGGDHVRLVGCNIRESASHGLLFSGAATIGTLVSGCEIVDNSQASVGAADGINVSGAVLSSFSVSGCILSDYQTVHTQRSGIRFEAAFNGGASTTIIGNQFSSNTGLAIDNQSTQAPTIFGNTGAGNAPGLTQRTRLTTGSVALSATADVTVAWPFTFIDTNYTVQAVCVEATGNLEVRAVKSITATQCVVTVKNNDGASARTGTLHLVAIHD